MRTPQVVARAVARAKPVIPDRAWPLLLSLRSMRGTGPLIGEPTARSVAVLAAHPDDESLGCAGTLALLRRAGVPVSVAFATDGEATRGAVTERSETARLRRAEATEACRRLGIDDVAFWGLPDGDLPARINELAPLIGAHVAGRDLVMLPWFLDGHPDHEALGAALDRAGIEPATELWGYETWVPVPANRLVDVTSVLEQKQAAIAAHATAAQAFDLEAALGLNRWRSIHGLMGRGYAEAFLAAPAQQWLALRAEALHG
jgi:LmbE family N-acetylglucosaminyl deacetylase